METEDHVPRAQHIDPIKSCLIRDDLHLRAHLRSKGHLLTPPLKEIRWTRAERSLQWHAENWHENILSMDRKFFTNEESSVTTRTTRFMLKRPLRCILKVWGCHQPSYIMVWWEVSHQGVTHLHFLQERHEAGVQVYQEDVLQGAVKQLNTTLFSGQESVFQEDSVPAQKPRGLRSGCEGAFCPLSVPRIGPRGVQTSTPGTINCGLFWGT
jgi:hypothetical protein